MNKMSLIQSIHYLLIAILLQSMMCSCSHSAITPNAQSNKPVALFPDYTGVTFPCNIAPPNFRIMEEGEAYYTEIGSGNRTFITVRSQASSVILPPDKWEKLLKQAAGSTSIFAFVSFRTENGYNFRRLQTLYPPLPSILI